MRYFPNKVIRGCRGKHRHPSLGAAKAHIRALTRRGLGGEAMRAYFCVRCHGYHVGHAEGAA